MEGTFHLAHSLILASSVRKSLFVMISTNILFISSLISSINPTPPNSFLPSLSPTFFLLFYASDAVIELAAALSQRAQRFCQLQGNKFSNFEKIQPIKIQFLLQMSNWVILFFLYEFWVFAALGVWVAEKRIWASSILSAHVIEERVPKMVEFGHVIAALVLLCPQCSNGLEDACLWPVSLSFSVLDAMITGTATTITTTSISFELLYPPLLSFL